MSEIKQTDIRGTVRSVSTIADLDALWEKIRVNEPARYSRLEAAGEYELQLKALGLAKPVKQEKTRKEN